MTEPNILPSRFGATETGADNENNYFKYGRDRFLRDRDRYIKMLKSGT